MSIQSPLLKNYITSNKSDFFVSDSHKKNFLSDTSSDAFVSDEKKSKKKKIARYALLGATAMSIGGAVLIALTHKKDIIKGKDFLKENIQNLAEYENGANNITNIKDSVIRKVMSKIPFYKKFDGAMSNLYRKTALNTVTKSYTKASGAIVEADKKLVSYIKNSLPTNENTNEILNILAKRAENIKEFTNKNHIAERFTDLNASMERLDKDALKKLSAIKGNVKPLLKKSVAVERLEQSKKLQNSMMKKYLNFGLSPEEKAKLKKFVGTIGDEKLKNGFFNAERKMMNSINKESSDLFAKLRDINFGCAPGDILGIAGTVGLLGLYTAQADSKEERVGVTLTTGIPLAVSLGTTVFATAKMVSGFRALGLGLLTGFVAKTIGNKANKKYQQAHNVQNPENTIVTLDDYAKKLTSDIKKSFQK